MTIVDENREQGERVEQEIRSSIATLRFGIQVCMCVTFVIMCVHVCVLVK